MQTPRKVPYIGPLSRRLDEISGLGFSLFCFLIYTALRLSCVEIFHNPLRIAGDTKVEMS